MKKKTKKTKKLSYKHLEAFVKFQSDKLAGLRGELCNEKQRADKFESAYLSLKNRIGEYFAMQADGRSKIDEARATCLRQAIFSEPSTLTQAQKFVQTFNTDFGNIGYLHGISGNYAERKP